VVRQYFLDARLIPVGRNPQTEFYELVGEKIESLNEALGIQVLSGRKDLITEECVIVG